jgi:hypothetical protein
VPATLVDERWPPSCHPVQLAPVRMTALGELIGPIAHPLLPLAGLEQAGVLLQPPCDLGHVACAAKVGPESGQPVVHNVRVRVVEAGQD